MPATDVRVLDANVVQSNVPLRPGLFGERTGDEVELIGGCVVVTLRRTALTLGLTAGQLHGQNGADHHHALGIDPLAQQLGQTDIKLETLNRKIGSAIPVGRIVD